MGNLWIAVTKRLPGKEGPYLITSAWSDRVMIAEYAPGPIWTVNGEVWGREDVLAWMPLPDPYRG